MSSGYVRHPSEIVKMGDEIEVRIVKYDRRKRRIDLSMMGITPDEEEADEEGEVPQLTSMEMALQRARNPQGSGSAPRASRKVPREVEERGITFVPCLDLDPRSPQLLVLHLELDLTHFKLVDEPQRFVGREAGRLRRPMPLHPLFRPPAQLGVLVRNDFAFAHAADLSAPADRRTFAGTIEGLRDGLGRTRRALRLSRRRSRAAR